MTQRIVQAADISIPARKRHIPLWGTVQQFGAFLGWVFSGFGMFKAFTKKNYRLDEVVVYKVHDAFYLWLLILTGFVGAWTVRHYPGSALAVGWVYVWVLAYTVITILFDINSIKIVVWGFVIGFVWILSKYLEDLKGFYLLTGIFRYIASLHPTLNPGFASVMSWVLLIPFIGALFHSFSYGRVTISPNSVEEWHLGIGSEITDRAGLKFRTRYDDLFESILGLGCGNLEALNNDHTVVKKYENIVLLFFWWSRLDEILHQRASIIDNAPGGKNDEVDEAA